MKHGTETASNASAGVGENAITSTQGLGVLHLKASFQNNFGLAILLGIHVWLQL